MTLGYDKPFYLMAFDHRGSFEHDLFGAAAECAASSANTTSSDANDGGSR